jgi:hypothetical protein
MRRGAANGAKEFMGILQIHTSLEARTQVYEDWVSACRKARLKADEVGDSAKSREYAEEEQRVLSLAAEQIGADATQCVAAVLSYVAL